MRVLVTGASGFIGRHAARILAEAGHEVISVSRHPAPVQAFTCIPCDLLAAGASTGLVNLVRPDVLLHLAWTTQHGHFWTDPANAIWRERSVDLVRAAIDGGAARIVMAGTCFEYDFAGGDPCDESATGLRNHTPYDTAKDACRRAVEALLPRHVSFAWARLFHLYGPYESPNRLVSSIARALVAGTPAATSSGRAVRDFMDARDAGAALAAVVMSRLQGPVNVASGEGVAIADVARALGDLAGRPDLVRIGALPDRPDEPASILARVDRLRNETAFAGPRPLRTGLAEALDWWARQMGRPAARDF